MQIAHQRLRVGGQEGSLPNRGRGGTPIEMFHIAHALTGVGYTVHLPQLARHCGTAEELHVTSRQHLYGSVEEERDRLC